MASTQGYKGAVYLAAQTSVSFTNEAMSETTANTVFTITDAAKRLWDDEATLTVQVDTGGGYATVTTGFTVDYVGGVVTFDPALGATDTVRVSGKYLTASQVGDAKEWSLDIEHSSEDDSVLGDEWEQPVQIQGKASGTLKLRWVDDTWLTHQSADSKVFLALYTDLAGADRYECMARIDKDSIGTSVASLIGEEVAFTVSGEVYYRDV